MHVCNNTDLKLPINIVQTNTRQIEKNFVACYDVAIYSTMKTCSLLVKF